MSADERRWELGKGSAAGLLSGLFLVVVYRAATQSLVHDEAFTYQLYLTGPVSNIFRVFDANLHFLAVLAMRVSTALFGFSEFAIRLPSVLACGWYFVTVYRLCGRSPVAVLLMAANPLVLDLLVAARGYSLALALLAYAIYAVDRPRRAGIAAGLAIAANLTFAIPVGVLGAALVVRRRRWVEFAAPVVLVVLLLMAASPLRHASPQAFYYGTPSLWTSGRVLTALSLAHNTGLGGWNREFVWSPWWRDFAMLVVAAIVLVRVRADVAAFVAAGSLAVLVVARYTVGLLYPLDRTGVYLLPLAGLAVARWRACLIFAGVLAGVYLGQLQWRSFYVWRYDADTKALVRALAAEPHGDHVTVGASWPLEPSLNYYRETMHLGWLAPVTRGGPGGDFDYYALTEAESGAVGALEVVYRGEISGTSLGRKRRSSSRFLPPVAAPAATPAVAGQDRRPSDR